MASIGSKWFGEGERYARAVFTLASKISPCVIFIDEVDSILGRRSKSGEHEVLIPFHAFCFSCKGNEKDKDRVNDDVGWIEDT